MKTPLRVHICVVGYELDRISKAAIREKADKVYLITQREDDKGRQYFEENKCILENEGIVVEEKYVDDISNLSHLLSKIKSIILSENKENVIYINISSGSTLAAIAGTLISMMLSESRKIVPYYVKPESYSEDSEDSKECSELNPRTIGVKQIIEILTFPIRLPQNELIIVLEYLQNEEKKGNPVTKKDLIEFSKQNDELSSIRENNRRLANKLKDSVEKKTSNTENDESKQKFKDYAWINQNIIHKLADEWGLIETTRFGKFSIIKLNDKGRNMLRYLKG